MLIMGGLSRSDRCAWGHPSARVAPASAGCGRAARARRAAPWGRRTVALAPVGLRVLLVASGDRPCTVAPLAPRRGRISDIPSPRWCSLRCRLYCEVGPLGLPRKRLPDYVDTALRRRHEVHEGEVVGQIAIE